MIHGVKLWFVFVFAVCSVSILNNKTVGLYPDGATSHRFKVAPALRNESAKHELLGFYLRDNCACTNMQRLMIWLRGYKCSHNFSPEPIRRPQECPISAIIAWKKLLLGKKFSKVQLLPIWKFKLAQQDLRYISML